MGRRRGWHLRRTLCRQASTQPELKQVNPLTTNVHGQYPDHVRRLYTKDELPARAENGAAARLEYTLVAVPASFNAVSLLAMAGKQASLLKRIWDKLRGRLGASGEEGWRCRAITAVHGQRRADAAVRVCGVPARRHVHSQSTRESPLGKLSGEVHCPLSRGHTTRWNFPYSLMLSIAA